MLVFGPSMCSASPIDPVCFNFTVTLLTLDEGKSLFRPYFVRNFRSVAERPSSFLKYCSTMKRSCSVVKRSFFTNPKLSAVKWFFSRVSNTLLNERWQIQILTLISGHPTLWIYKLWKVLRYFSSKQKFWIQFIFSKI